jgi:hypothetical protein
MGDFEIFVGGAFVTVWLVSFFGYSALQLRKGYQKVVPRAVHERDALPLPRTELVVRLISGSPDQDSLSTH